MSVSLMLKTEEGKAAGYVLLLENRLLWSFKGRGEEGLLSLLGSDGEEREIAVCCDGCEREKQYSGPPPEGAYVTIGDVLYAATCVRARGAYAQRTQDRSEKSGINEEKSAQPCKKDGAARVYIGEAVGQAVLPPPALPERRWPPPPCWPQARYCAGVWGGGDN